MEEYKFDGTLEELKLFLGDEYEVSVYSMKPILRESGNLARDYDYKLLRKEDNTVKIIPYRSKFKILNNKLYINDEEL